MRGLLVSVLQLLAGCSQAERTLPGLEWRVVADVPLPGAAARFDYQSFDPTSGRLWIAHMGADEVLCFDVRTRRIVARVHDMRGVTGVRAVPALGRVFASLSEEPGVVALDAATGRVVAHVAGGRFPDGLAYAPGPRRLFVSDEHGRRELVIDVPTFTARPPIPMGGDVGNTQYDSVSGLVWVAVQSSNELAAIDPVEGLVVVRAPVPGIDQPHGFLIDPTHRVAYVTGEGNGRMAALNLRTMRVERTYAVGEDPDVLAMDPGRGRLFVAAESGVVAAFEARGDSLVVLPAYQAAQAHSVAVDPATHLIYLPLENVGGRPVLRILSLEKR
ncbi:MAG: YncE family protein [Gemmatimonadales bacterium]